MLFFIAFACYGLVTSQDTDAELFFNDGTSIEGYGMLHKTDKIKFRISLDDKPDIWTKLMVKKITFYGFNMSTTFEYVQLKPDKPATLVEVLVYENTKLFSDVTTYYFYANHGMTNGLPTSRSRQQFSISKIYIQKEGDEFPVALTGNFRRKVKEYFSDCTGLVNKVNSGEFRKSTVKDMIYYYNDFYTE
ncbi:hypothetical protein [Aquimarina intermedia]|uniref:Uncharacterized protein n=1 Tax=Aquimarina intermedia TaxID=350814 RepID=A0A5S5C5S6_9FLAO|nr:hypothetical protein [Aquimarina intermedia]TYP73670.1 hypothetical protein BD809_105261 [Aquimarina intermedia]